MYQIRSRPQKIHFRRLRKIYRKFLASRKSVLDCSRQTRKKRSDKTEYRAAQLRNVQFIGSNERNPRTQQRYTDFLAAPGRACAFGAKLRGHARSARTAPVQWVRTLHRLRSDAHCPQYSRAERCRCLCLSARSLSAMLRLFGKFGIAFRHAFKRNTLCSLRDRLLGRDDALAVFL